MGSWSAFHWVIFGLIVFVIFKAAKGGGGETKHCMTCGTDGKTKSRTRGSIFIEIILWLCFIVPGIIYSIWRLTTRRDVCGACGSEAVVPEGAPAALAHKRDMAGGGAPFVAQRKDEYANLGLNK